MFLSAWSLSLIICSGVVLFLGAGAVRTAIRVIRYWDPASDSDLQISLENETWLASTLVEYALVVQGLSLLIFVLAADSYSQVIAGAMCATGSLLANEHGMPALYLKLGGFFFYGFWILLHQLDIRSESYPLVRLKFLYLLLLVPLVIGDITYQILYIAGLDPDIITSCCAVVFSSAAGEGTNLVDSIPRPLIMPVFYGSMAVLALTGLFLNGWLPLKAPRSGGVARMASSLAYGIGWLCFFVLALVVITSTISSYIYAMPFHRCPFCIIKPEYHYFGLFIYLFLIGGAFSGISVALIEAVGRRGDLAAQASGFSRQAVMFSLLALLVFAILSSWHYVLYTIFGGEI